MPDKNKEFMAPGEVAIWLDDARKEYGEPDLLLNDPELGRRAPTAEEAHDLGLDRLAS